MANAGPNTNGSQFFIVTAGEALARRQAHVFGQVTAGQDVVDRISVVDRDSATIPRAIGIEPVELREWLSSEVHQLANVDSAVPGSSLQFEGTRLKPRETLVDHVPCQADVRRDKAQHRWTTLAAGTAVVTGASSGHRCGDRAQAREAGVRVVGGAAASSGRSRRRAAARRHRRGERGAFVDAAVEPSSAASTSCTTTPASRSAASRSRSRRPRTRRQSCTRTSTACCGSRGSACRMSATRATSCSWARSPAGRRTPTARRTSRRSSRCAASRTRCERTCSAGRSGSRRSTPASSRRSSRSSASGATEEKAKAVYEGLEPVTPDEVADCVHVRADPAAARERRRDRGQGARSSRAALESSGASSPPSASACGSARLRPQDPAARRARARALAAEPLYILVDTAIVGHLGRSQLAALGAAATALRCSRCSTSSSTGRPRRSRATRAGRAPPRAPRRAGALASLAIGVTLAAAGRGARRADRGSRRRRGRRPPTTPPVPAHRLDRHPVVLPRARRSGIPPRHLGLTSPLVVIVLANLLNVVLEVLFVYGFDWGIEGSAWGTAVAQTCMGARVHLARRPVGARGPRAR